MKPHWEHNRLRHRSIVSPRLFLCSVCVNGNGWKCSSGFRCVIVMARHKCLVVMLPHLYFWPIVRYRGEYWCVLHLHFQVFGTSTVIGGNSAVILQANVIVPDSLYKGVFAGHLLKIASANRELFSKSIVTGHLLQNTRERDRGGEWLLQSICEENKRKDKPVIKRVWRRQREGCWRRLLRVERSEPV